jgi:arylformamidase
MKYTVEFCEREYNARAMIPEHPQIFARWAEQAAATRRLRACLIDLAFGEHAAERLDLFPSRSDGAPLLVFLHGGYWRSLDKSDFSWIAPAFVNHGISVALLNYGLAPKTPMEEIVRQVLRGHAWLYRNADRLGFDPTRIYTAGHSAGGHLTAMMLAALWPVFDPELPAHLVKGGLAVSGLFELEPLLYAPFLASDLQLDLPRAKRLSPALLPPATKAPLYTSVGGLESNEFKRQSALIAKAWRANVLRDVPMPGFNHLTICDELANPASPLFDAAIELIRRR